MNQENVEPHPEHYGQRQNPNWARLGTAGFILLVMVGGGIRRAMQNAPPQTPVFQSEAVDSTLEPSDQEIKETIQTYLDTNGELGGASLMLLGIKEEADKLLKQKREREGAANDAQDAKNSQDTQDPERAGQSPDDHQSRE